MTPNNTHTGNLTTMPEKSHKDDCDERQTRFTGILDLSSHTTLTVQDKLAKNSTFHVVMQHKSLFMCGSLL